MQSRRQRARHRGSSAERAASWRRSQRRVVVACAMMLPPMGLMLGPANMAPPSRLAATTCAPACTHRTTTSAPAPTRDVPAHPLPRQSSPRAPHLVGDDHAHAKLVGQPLQAPQELAQRHLAPRQLASAGKLRPARPLPRQPGERWPADHHQLGAAGVLPGRSAGRWGHVAGRRVGPHLKSAVALSTMMRPKRDCAMVEAACCSRFCWWSVLCARA